MYSGAQDYPPLYESGFEADQGFAAGSVDGQQGWTVERGEAVVSDGDGRDGSRGLRIQPSSPAGSVSVSVALPVEADGGIVFSDVWVRPGADNDPAGAGFSEFEGSFTGFFRVSDGGELFVFNGNWRAPSMR